MSNSLEDKQQINDSIMKSEFNLCKKKIKKKINCNYVKSCQSYDETLDNYCDEYDDKYDKFYNN